MLNRQSRRFVLLVSIVMVIVAAASFYRAGSTGKVNYKEHLSDNILTINGEDLTLSDIAFYIAFEEIQVEEQARIYDEKNTNKYWNLHINGEFIKISTKQAVIDTAVHDWIFYQMAEENGTALTEEETTLYKNTAYDFWMDLSEEQKERIGISYEDVEENVRQIALAEKAQQEYAASVNRSFSTFAYDASGYAELLKEHRVKVNKRLWRRIDYGNIIVHFE